MVAGGDGYSALGRGKVLIGKTDGKLMASVVMAHVRAAGAVQARARGADRHPLSRAAPAAAMGHAAALGAFVSGLGGGGWAALRSSRRRGPARLRRRWTCAPPAASASCPLPPRSSPRWR